jgi:2,3-dihydro-2,3-dihydroxybenzoate dehydrogenase
VTGAETTIVTGAASGIGAAVAELLLERGTRVARWDVKTPEPRAGALFQRVDVRDSASISAALDATERELGPVTGLVNAAGVLAASPMLSLESTDAEFARVFSVNVEGVWQVSRAVARRMVERQRGAIVTVASNAGAVPRVGLGAYCASKAAAAMLTRCLGLELAAHGVRCNVVSPGSTDTPMLRDLLGEADLQAAVTGDAAAFRLGIPLGRVAQPRDVAEAVSFLLSERARHITLQDLKVDGGATL